MTQVIVFPRGQLSPSDKGRLTKVGIIAIEADSPKDVCQLNLSAPLLSSCVNGDSIVRSALAAISNFPAQDAYGNIKSGGLIAHEFVSLLNNYVKDAK